MSIITYILHVIPRYTISNTYRYINCTIPVSVQARYGKLCPIKSSSHYNGSLVAVRLIITNI
jgi:hypothetical protein